MLGWVGAVGGLLLTAGLWVGFGAFRDVGLLVKLRRLVVGVGFLAVGSLCLALTIALRAFEAFATSREVAEVRCQWVGPKEFELSYTAIRDDEPQAPKTFRLRGDQWSISGGVVKWHPWLTALGLPSYHKPTRISGRYANTAEEIAAPPTAFDLDGPIDPVWWWFYRASPFLPFVETTYGSAAFTYVNPAVVLEVDVTPSGYLVTRKRPQLAHRPASSS